MSLEEDATKEFVIPGRVSDTTAPSVPIVKAIDPGASSIISGTPEPYGTIIVTLPNGQECSVVAVETGFWSIISLISLKKGDKILGIARDESYSMSPYTEVVVGAELYEKIEGNYLPLTG